MTIATDLKKNICQRWSQPERVKGWVSSGLNAEYSDPSCRRAWLKAFRQAVGKVHAGDALDVGTGPGTIAQFWAELGYSTTGVDFSPGMLDAARADAAAKKLKIRFIEGDAEEPPVSRKKFDIISSRFVLFTLPHPGYAMRRWVELLRPGGRIVVIGHEHAMDMRHRPPQKKQLQSKIDKQHQESLKQLPFVHHKLGDLIVLLEAVGLCDIQRIPMEQVVAARTAFGKRNKEVFRNTPFILVGRKER